jgi:hypothetical protein
LTRIIGGLIVLLFLMYSHPAVHAQADCGLVNRVQFPVDRAVFQLVQDYAVPSVRHQGRWHTGEDYSAGPGATLGQPVAAIAAGRVTYASPIGWGRDGGVVILEHTLPDGSQVYSQYGHLMETDSIRFPGVLACVQAGQVIGAIADVRPGPHLHFEIRINQPDTPGPGYTADIPDTLGWRVPSAFVLNWSVWLGDLHRWHVALPAPLTTPPLIDDDGSVLIASSDNRVRYALPDGRILWRVILDSAPTLLTGSEAGPVVTMADGAAWTLGADGSVIDRRAGAAAASVDLGEGALLLLDSGRYQLTPGVPALLTSGPPDAEPLWRVGLPGLRGAVRLSADSTGQVLIVSAASGQVILVGAASGQVCGQVEFYGNGRGFVWHELGADGLLRVALGDQVTGLDWARLSSQC